MMTRTIMIAAFGLLLLIAHASAPAMAATATASAAARVTVQVPQTAKAASVAMLELSVRARGTGNLGGVVRLSGGGNAVEVGRFSAAAAGEQRFQFNVTLALRHLGLSAGPATVEVALIDRAGGAAPGGASLVIGEARIIAR